MRVACPWACSTASGNEMRTAPGLRCAASAIISHDVWTYSTLFPAERLAPADTAHRKAAATDVCVKTDVDRACKTTHSQDHKSGRLTQRAHGTKGCRYNKNCAINQTEPKRKNRKKMKRTPTVRMLAGFKSANALTVPMVSFSSCSVDSRFNRRAQSFESQREKDSGAA